MKYLNGFQKFNEETELKIDDLSKLKSGVKIGDTLVNKLKGDEPLTTNSDKQVEIENTDNIINNITDDGEYDNSKAKKYLKPGSRYTKVFKGDDGNEYQLNNFKKTSEFGSKGAGVNTIRNEIIQVIYLGIRQELGIDLDENKMVEYFNYFKYKVIGSSVFISKNDETIIDDYINAIDVNKNWLATFCKVPNKIFSIDNYLDLSKKYKIYHNSYKGNGSPFISILNKYKSFIKSKTNINKFCPADCYLVDINSGLEVLNVINNSIDINDLRNNMNDLFTQKKLIPISLKQINSNSAFSIITNSENGRTDINCFLEEVNITKDPFIGIESEVIVRGNWVKRDAIRNFRRKMTLRSGRTSINQNIRAEITGSMTRHGNMALDQIRPYFNNININGYKELIKLDESEIKKMIMTIYNDLLKYELVENKKGGYKIENTENSKNKYISKLQSLQFVKSILDMYNDNPQATNRKFTKIVKYTLSIESSEFKSPKYLRVI